MIHRVGPLEEFASGTITIVQVAGRSVGIVNAGDKLYAVLNVCPHALAPVCEGRLTGTLLPSEPGQAVWGMDERILRCPWHGFEFDLENNGQTVFTSFKARVRMFPVSTAEGEVCVEMPDLHGRRSGGATFELR
jgi:3-phenylpropionate/trans-cinnamate dioxygenase ferredoxin subunit